jgi:hypothetical protein
LKEKGVLPVGKALGLAEMAFFFQGYGFVHKLPGEEDKRRRCLGWVRVEEKTGTNRMLALAKERIRNNATLRQLIIAE